MAARILNIPIYKIVDSPFQGRFFQAKDLKNPHVRKQLEELKRSIENAGLLQPITVRRVKDKYELIDGHRRLEAYRQLDKGNIPAIIKEADDKTPR
ncbi:MAG: ParB N-terminal domain-containing protein [Bacteroidota bacterium]|nr:ParB N-terminal domain-containing protein [Bacteroidota bacterium]